MYGIVTGVLASRSRRSLLEKVDIGLDRVIICAPYVTLTAQIVGSLTDHTLEWVQVSGIEVDWGMSDLTSNEVVYSETGAVRDDKQFRLWVDRGTAREYYKTVWIYGTPTELINGAIGAADQSSIFALPTEINANMWFIPAPDSTGAVIYTPMPKTGYIYWDLPSNITSVVATAIEINNTGSYVQAKFVPVNDNARFISADIATTTFRIRIFFLTRDGATRSVLTPSKSFGEIAPANVGAVITETMLPFSALATTLNKVTNIFKPLIYEVSDIAQASRAAAGPLYLSSTILYTLKAQDVVEELQAGISAKGSAFSRTTTIGTITIIGSS